MSDNFEVVCYAIRNEIRGFESTGGYRNDPDDPGGETKFGIAKRDHPNVDIGNLTMPGAAAILISEYCAGESLVSNEIAAKFVDLAINMEGTGKCGAAVKIAQQAAEIQFPGALTIDGVYGEETERTLNACNVASVLMSMDALGCAHYRAIVAARAASQKYLDGWIARANRIPECNPNAPRGEKIQPASQKKPAAG